MWGGRCLRRRRIKGDALRSRCAQQATNSVWGKPDPALSRFQNDALVAARVLAFLQASERAVAEMGADGRVVLVGEAVLAGDAPDATDELRVRIARQLGQGGGQ